MKPSTLTSLAAAGLVIPSCIGLLLTGVPTVVCPLPVVTILPAFMLASLSLHWLAVFVPSLLFIAWSPQLFWGGRELPKRSAGLLLALTVLSAVYFWADWAFALGYHGRSYTVAVCCINIVWLVLLWTSLIRLWRAQSFVRSLLFHWTLFAWLAWYAFPYLGELP